MLHRHENTVFRLVLVLEKIFLMQTISEVFTEFGAMLHLRYVLGFGHQAGGTFAPQPRIKPAPPSLAGEVFTTGWLGSTPL